MEPRSIQKNRSGPRGVFKSRYLGLRRSRLDGEIEQRCQETQEITIFETIKDAKNKAFLLIKKGNARLDPYILPYYICFRKIHPNFGVNVYNQYTFDAN